MTAIDGMHRIRRAVFEVRTADETSLGPTQRALRQLFDDVIEPALSEWFESLEDGRHHHLDRLEIDLGRIALGESDNDAVRRVVLKQLGFRFFHNRREATPPLSGPESLSQTLLEFIGTGRWPWHASFRAVEELEAALADLPNAALPALVLRLRNVLHDVNARQRLIHQFSDEGFAWFIRQLQPAAADMLLRAVAKGQAEVASAAAKLASLSVAVDLPVDKMVPLDEVFNIVLRRIESAKPIRAGGADVPATHQSADGDVRRSETSHRDLESASDEPSGDAPWYVRGAGIVLLHPFLPRFFETLDLLDSGETFISEDACVVAVHLLHYLVNGTEHPDEPETTLYKLLCGLPADVPLIKRLPLAGGLKQESDNLLAAVVGHWKKLGNTSPDGLRQTFLQRDGKLTREAGRVTLIVQHKTVDVLMANLPWSISIVRLPWMQSPLWVDWA